MCISHYLTGCNRISIQPPIKKDGIVPDWYTIDINMGKVIKKRTIDITKEFGKEKKREEQSNNKKGGPQPKPEKW